MFSLTTGLLAILKVNINDYKTTIFLILYKDECSIFNWNTNNPKKELSLDKI